MSTEYRCGTPGRRQRMVALPPGNTINAIDFLTVVDGAGIPSLLRQRLLRLRMFSAEGVDLLTQAQVIIEGGVRVPRPAIRWAMALPAVVAPGGPADLPGSDPALDNDARDWLTDLAADTPDPDRWLLVMTEEPGDFSRYQLRLRSGPGSSDPPGDFDPLLGTVEFSFKVECPSPFDCASDDSCPPEASAPVRIDYLARDFASFRRLMFDRMSLTQPQDPSQEAATTRATIVEALAYAADQVSYYLDAVNNETYLGTARNRVSVRRHARLRDYPMHEGCNARTFVHLRISDGDEAVALPADPPLIPAGTMLLTRVARHGSVIRPEGLRDALSQRPEAFEAMHPLRVLSDAHNEILLHTWGDSDCCLPPGSTRATLRDPGQRLRLAPGDFLVFEEVRDRGTGHLANASPDRRHVVELVTVSDSRVDALMSVGEAEPVRYVEVSWHAADALPFPLWVGSSATPYTIARANLLLVDHGRRVQTAADEPLVQEPFGNQGRLRARLPIPELTWASTYLPGRSATTSMVQDPRRARPSVGLEGEGEVWIPQRDLLGSAPSARDFVVETESDRRAWIRFGDDVMGRKPTRTTAFSASYRVGNGPRGNVGAEAIAHLVAPPGEVPADTAAIIVAVRNPVPGLGGTEPESIEAVKRHAPQAFRRQERAVTMEDWAEVAKRHPEVQRAVARLQWNGSGYSVVLVVDRREGRDVDQPFRDELEAFLERFRLAGYDLEVAPPRFAPLDISLSICVEPTNFAGEVQRRLLEELGTGRLSDGRLGFFHPDALTFGQPVYLSQIVARLEGIAGVRWVDATPRRFPFHRFHRFKRWGRVAQGEIQRGRIDIGPLEIARCDNDPNAPDNGQIQLHMEGGA